MLQQATYVDLIVLKGRMRRAVRIIVLVLTCLVALPEFAAAQNGTFDDTFTRISTLAQAAQYSEALDQARMATSRIRAEFGEDDVTFARALAWEAYLLQVLSRIAEAEPLFKRSLEIYTRLLPPGHPDVATATNNLAFQYQITDRLEEAERLYKSSLEMREKALPAMSPAIAESLNNIAQVYKHQGRTEEAIPLLRRSLDIRLRSLKPSDPLIAQSLANLGGAYERQGWFPEAEPLFRKALSVRRASQAPNHPEIAGITSKIAQNLARQGRLEEADKLFEEALTLRFKSQPTDHIDIAGSLQDRAQNLIQLKQYAQAEELLNKALAIQTNALPPNHPSMAHTLADLANVALFENKLDVALERIREGVKILLTRGKIDHLGKQRFSEFVKIAWRAFQSKEKEGKRAGDLLDEALRNAQRAADTQTGAAVTRMAARFAAKDESLHSVMRERDDAEARQSMLEQELSSVLALPVNKRGDRASTVRSQLADISARITSIDVELKAQFPKYFGLIKPEPLDIGRIQRILRPDEALLSYFSGFDESYVWAVTSDGAEWRQLEVNPKELADEIATLRSSLDVNTIARQGANAKLFDLGLAHDLDTRLLAPIEKLISKKANLIIVANGALTSLPFQLLVASQPAVAHPTLAQIAAYRDADWLIRRHAITVLPSVTSLQSIREVAGVPQSREPFIGFGNPVLGNQEKVAAAEAGQLVKTAMHQVTRGYSAFWRGPAADPEALRMGLSPLPETEAEIKTVAGNLGAGEGNVRLGAAATEAAIKSADLQAYRIIYFATHGLVAGEVQGLGEPALVFTLPDVASDLDDGLLTASEVTQLQLDAEWVVLSACNTAAGETPGAEALSGLARGFFHAGARAMLVSHWRVGSEAAAKLTTGTFDVLKSDPQAGRAEALRRAMLAMVNDTTDPWNPYPTFWAPFSVVGEGRN